MKAIPKWTAAAAAAGLIIQIWPGAFEVLRFHRAEILSGEFWRLWTGHLTHASWTLWFWNTLAFLILGVQAEKRMRRVYLPFLGFAALFIGAGILAAAPGLAWYCGLSGLDTALFAYLLLADGRRAWRFGDRTLLAVNLFGAACVGGKVAYEYATGQVFFARASGLPPAPAAHLLGALAGAAFMAGSRTSARAPMSILRS